MGLSTATVPVQKRRSPALDSFRAAKVDQLRERYKKGTYEIDASAVATKIVDAYIEKKS